MVRITYNGEDYEEPSYNDLYDILKSKSESESESESTAVIDAMESLNNQLKRSNANKMSQMIALFEQENLSLSEVKKKNDFRNSQNENTKATFVERYLFLIIKILFFVVFFCFFLYTLKDSFVESATLPPNKNSI